MSVQYATVQWNRRKVAYDLAALAGVALYLWAFRAVARATLHGREAITSQILDMRAWGSCAFLLLTLILCIGPLARLDRRFLPLLYNRRHLGVLMCGVTLMHAYTVYAYYPQYGSVPPAVAMLTTDTAFTPASWPFPVLGMLALTIVLAMAVSSHDFWQRFLGATGWKWLHMSVYVAFALAVLHVAFGAMQSELHPIVPAMVGAAALLVVSLHVASARRSSAPDRTPARIVELEGERWIDAGAPEAVLEGRARPVCPPEGERIALVRAGGKLSAVHGVCAHQGGPLYEGRVIDGCLTCPWHGWQYRPGDGQSPPPFTERLPTYPVRLVDGRVLVRLRALPPGTATDPIDLAVPTARAPTDDAPPTDRAGDDVTTQEAGT